MGEEEAEGGEEGWGEGEGGGVEGLVDLTGAGDGVDTVGLFLLSLLPVCISLLVILSNSSGTMAPFRSHCPALRVLLLRETGLEFLGFLGAEVVPGADYVAAVRVGAAGEVGEEGEHFGGVAA